MLPEGPSQPITSVDILRDNSKVVAASKDGTCYIYALGAMNNEKYKLIDKICFKCRPDAKNMVPRACLFRRDGGVYTMHVFGRDPTYMIHWKEDQKTKKYQPINTQQVHNGPSTGMKALGFNLCVMTSDGKFVMVSPDTLKPTLTSKKLHNMPV